MQCRLSGILGLLSRRGCIRRYAAGTCFMNPAASRSCLNASESGGIEDDHLKATLESGENVCVWADIEFYKTFNQKDESDRYAAEESFAAALGSDFHNDGEGDGSTGHIESYCSDFLGTENPARVSGADGRTPTK